jgi:hypothetical protein
MRRRKGRGSTKSTRRSCSSEASRLRCSSLAGARRAARRPALAKPILQRCATVLAFHDDELRLPNRAGGGRMLCMHEGGKLHVVWRHEGPAHVRSNIHPLLGLFSGCGMHRTEMFVDLRPTTI